MDKEILADYIRNERVRGVSDVAIRVELESKGWKKGDIYAVLPPNEDERATRWGGIFSGPTELIALKVLSIGFGLFLVSSAMLYLYGAGSELNNRYVFGAFSLTHVINALAAFFLFYSVWKLSHSGWFRIWVGSLALAVALFALSSLVHLVSLAFAVDIFNVTTRVFNDGAALQLIIYFVLLPLQVVVFLLLMITLWCFRLVRRRNGGNLPLLRTHMKTVGIFMLMAILAIGDLYLVLSGFHW